MTKQYCVVIFPKDKNTDETVEVVPSQWVKGDKCLWPTESEGKIKKLIKDCGEPQSEWETYIVKVYGYSSKCNMFLQTQSNSIYINTIQNLLN